MLAPVSFSFGDVFSIVNGESPQLPGMLFSTTPFDFDPVNGFTGTDYTGAADVEAFHEVSSVPEPATLALTATGLAALLACRRRTRRA